MKDTGEIRLQGIAASRGISIGPVYCFSSPDLTIPHRQLESTSQEMSRFIKAVDSARAELQELHADLLKRAGEKEAAIFEAHQMILDDPTLRKKMEQQVEQGQIIEQALMSTIEDFANMLAAMTDELFAARAADVRDVGRRILRILLGLPDQSLKMVHSPSIIMAQDLTPSDTASMDPKLSLGFCTAAGGLTSHSAILARTLGIPAIVALGEELSQKVSAGDLVILDGLEGILIVHPCEETLQKYRNIQEKQAARDREFRSNAMQPARTADGKMIEVAANIGNAESARMAVANGAEGVGLLRTEFLYLEEKEPPPEEKQFGIYKEIFEIMGQRPVIVRTLDIGGDKPPSYLRFPQEMNPFLGWRAIRISLDRPELFKTQLRAILRAAFGYQVRIMFPMIDGLDELRRARQMVEEAKNELKVEALPYADDIPVGIMVETPAAAVLVDVLSEAADFFSLGTNDLTQYTLAVDRGNATIASLYQPFHPAVLRLIKQTIDLAHQKGKWVGMCGELAGMSMAIPILLGLGLDEFSMNPRAIPESKNLINHLTVEQSRHIAEKVLSLGTSAEIEGFIRQVLADL
jgi:phosphotransferase system enzyme I (PtsI)